MRCKGEDASSLELLLDTMCNTFGGVMFIAISLVVVIAMVRSVAPVVENYTPDKLEHLQEELAQLEREVGESQRTVERRQELAQLLATAPMQEELEKLTILAEKKRSLETLKELDEAKLALIQAEVAAQENTIEKLKSEIGNTSKALEETEKTRRELEGKLGTLIAKLGSTPMRAMNFKVLRQSSKSPWFLVIRHNKVWQVGPKSVSGQMLPHSDVTSIPLERGVRCELRSDAGVPILLDGKISPELHAILEMIPSDRVPDFFVDSDSAEAFFLVREQLKAENKMHGWEPHLLENFFEYLVVMRDYHEY